MTKDVKNAAFAPVSTIKGNCLKVMLTLLDNSVDMVLTDIPYGAVNRKSSGLRNLDKGIADVVTFQIEPFIKTLIRVCSGSFYVFCGTEQVSEIRKAFVQAGLTTRLGIWEKTNPSPMNGTRLWLSSIECCVFARKANAVFNEHCQSVVWRCATTRGKIHPTQKPLKLMERLVLASSSKGQIILDPCMGSGTTGVACVRNNRKFIGIEIVSEYYEAAKSRIANE